MLRPSAVTRCSETLLLRSLLDESGLQNASAESAHVVDLLISPTYIYDTCDVLRARGDPNAGNTSVLACP